MFACVAYRVSPEEEQVNALTRGSGVTVLALGISISLDELAMGFTIGLIDVSIIGAVILIGAQAFLVSQIGLRLGARLGEASREWAERIAAFALLGLARRLHSRSEASWRP